MPGRLETDAGARSVHADPRGEAHVGRDARAVAARVGRGGRSVQAAPPVVGGGDGVGRVRLVVGDARGGVAREVVVLGRYQAGVAGPAPDQDTGAVAGDRVVRDGGRCAGRDIDAGLTVIRDRIAGTGRGPADRRTPRAGNVNAVARSPRRRCRPHSCRSSCPRPGRTHRCKRRTSVFPEMMLPAPVVVPPIVAPEAAT